MEQAFFFGYLSGPIPKSLKLYLNQYHTSIKLTAFCKNLVDKQKDNYRDNLDIIKDRYNLW